MMLLKKNVQRQRLFERRRGKRQQPAGTIIHQITNVVMNDLIAKNEILWEFDDRFAVRG